MINVNVSLKHIIYVKKIMFGILVRVLVKMENIMDDSTIICDQVIDPFNEEVKTIPTNFNEKKVTCKTQNFYSLLAFLLVTIALTLVFTVSIYCYFKLNLKSIVLIV